MAGHVLVCISDIDIGLAPLELRLGRASVCQNVCVGGPWNFHESSKNASAVFGKNSRKIAKACRLFSVNFHGK